MTPPCSRPAPRPAPRAPRPDAGSARAGAALGAEGARPGRQSCGLNADAPWDPVPLSAPLLAPPIPRRARQTSNARTREVRSRRRHRRRHCRARARLAPPPRPRAEDAGRWRRLQGRGDAGPPLSAKVPAGESFVRIVARFLVDLPSGEPRAAAAAALLAALVPARPPSRSPDQWLQGPDQRLQRHQPGPPLPRKRLSTEPLAQPSRRAQERRRASPRCILLLFAALAVAAEHLRSQPSADALALSGAKPRLLVPRRETARFGQPPRGCSNVVGPARRGLARL
jgi:hypothetical protein